MGDYKLDFYFVLRNAIEKGKILEKIWGEIIYKKSVRESFSGWLPFFNKKSLKTHTT